MGDKLLYIYETLLAHYGELNWWPARTPYEVVVGAALTQNTAWTNVEKAITGCGYGWRRHLCRPDTVRNKKGGAKTSATL